MARIEFPIATTDGELFQHEGVLYQYQGTPPSGFWAANTQNILIDAFVDSAGDVMSGDLTISNLAGTGSAGVGVDSTGKLIRTDTTTDLTSPFVNTGGDTLSGPLHFTNSLGNITLSLYHQSGSGSFNGNLTSGNFDIDTPATASASGGGIVSGSLYAKRSDSNNVEVFSGYNITGDVTSGIFGDGGAVFGDGNISLTATGSVGSLHFIADGPYQNSNSIRQTIKDSTGTKGKVVLGDGTTAIGGSLGAYPSSGSPNILLSADGTVDAENMTCTGLDVQGNITLSGQLSGSTKLLLQASGDATLRDLTVDGISGESATFSTSLSAGNVTLSSSGIRIENNNKVIQLFADGASTIAENLVVDGSINASQLAISGSVSATSYGAVSGTTATFTGDITVNNADIQGDLTVLSDLAVTDITASNIEATGNLATTGSGLFSNQRINFSVDGSVVTHSSDKGIELGTGGSGPDTSMLKGFSGSSGAGTGSQRFNFTGDGAVSLASGNCTVSPDGDVQNVNNSYGAISDRKFKQDITPAQSQWDDVLAVELVNYSFKPELGWGTGRRLGVISQDLRRVCPALVDVKKDYKQVTTPMFDEQGMPVVDDEGDQLYESIKQETGTKTESVKYSVLHLKAFGALQEVMRRVEKLESQQN